MSIQRAQGVLLFLVRFNNSGRFEIYRVTRSSSSRPFLCALVCMYHFLGCHTLYIRMYACVCVCMYVCMCVYVCVCMHVCMYVCMYVCIMYMHVLYVCIMYIVCIYVCIGYVLFIRYYVVNMYICCVLRWLFNLAKCALAKSKLQIGLHAGDHKIVSLKCLILDSYHIYSSFLAELSYFGRDSK